MTGPGWWDERRYGLIVHANIATVPSFSPIGPRADWYWAHLDGNPPLAEVLAYHRDRWAHVADYDEFIPFLTLHRFDADELVDPVRVERDHLRLEPRPADRLHEVVIRPVAAHDGLGREPHRGEDDSTGVEHGAVEITEDAQVTHAPAGDRVLTVKTAGKRERTR